jgi:hypothetical protein
MKTFVLPFFCTHGGVWSASRFFFLTGLVALGLSGCTPPKDTTVPAAATPEKSTANQVIEGFTGKTSVDAGQRAKAQIKEINAIRTNSFEEF